MNFSVRQGIDDFIFFFGQCRFFLVCRIDAHLSFALQLQPGRYGSLIDFARIRHVVCTHPFPEFKLRKTDDRMLIQQADDFFGLVEGGSHAVDNADDARVHFLPAKRDYHTHAGAHRTRPLIRNGISERVAQWQRKYDVNVFHQIV